MAERVPITLRLPADLLQRVRAAAEAAGSSVNDLLARAAEDRVSAMEYEAASRLRLEHHRRIAERLGGPLPDSAALIRHLREEGRDAVRDEARLPRQ